MPDYKSPGSKSDLEEEAAATPEVKTKPADQHLDFSSDPVSFDHAPGVIVGDTYDSRPQEDGARRNIAYLLIGLLWVIVLGIFALLSFSSIKVDAIKEFAVVLGPVVALVSAATGFYYGTKSTTPTSAPPTAK
jgi:hypothetical protein